VPGKQLKRCYCSAGTAGGLRVSAAGSAIPAASVWKCERPGGESISIQEACRLAYSVPAWSGSNLPTQLPH